MESISLRARTNTVIPLVPLACKSANTVAAAANMSMDVNVAIRDHTLPANTAAVMRAITLLRRNHTTTVPVLEAREEKGKGRGKSRESVVRNVEAMRLKKRLEQHSLAVRSVDVSDIQIGSNFDKLTIRTGAGHEFGHSNSLVTVAGALAGAYAGHKLEVKHEKDKKKKEERRANEALGYGEYYEDDGRRRSRSLSRRRSRSRRRSESGSGSDSDDSRRRRHHHH